MIKITDLKDVRAGDVVTIVTHGEEYTGRAVADGDGDILFAGAYIRLDGAPNSWGYEFLHAYREKVLPTEYLSVIKDIETRSGATYALGVRDGRVGSPWRVWNNETGQDFLSDSEVLTWTEVEVW